MNKTLNHLAWLIHSLQDKVKRPLSRWNFITNVVTSGTSDSPSAVTSQRRSQKMGSVTVIAILQAIIACLSLHHHGNTPT